MAFSRIWTKSGNAMMCTHCTAVVEQKPYFRGLVVYQAGELFSSDDSGGVWPSRKSSDQAVSYRRTQDPTRPFVCSEMSSIWGQLSDHRIGRNAGGKAGQNVSPIARCTREPKRRWFVRCQKRCCGTPSPYRVPSHKYQVQIHVVTRLTQFFFC